MSFEQWLAAAHAEWLRTREHIRYGQALFNSLHDVRPDISERVRATSLDPFYDNGAVPDFLIAVEAMWSD